MARGEWWSDRELHPDFRCAKPVSSWLDDRPNWGRRARNELNAVLRIWNPIGLHDLVPQGVTGGDRTRACRATTCRAIRYTTATVRRVGIEPTPLGLQPSATTRSAFGGRPVGESHPRPEGENLGSLLLAERAFRIGGAAAENRTQCASLRGRIPTIGSTAWLHRVDSNHR